MPVVLVRGQPASADVGDAASQPRRNSSAGTLTLAVSALRGLAC